MQNILGALGVLSALLIRFCHTDRRSPVCWQFGTSNGFGLGLPECADLLHIVGVRTRSGP